MRFSAAIALSFALLLGFSLCVAVNFTLQLLQ